MDLLKGIILAPILIAVFICSGSHSSQLYLQPQQTQHGYFTNDSFFITCFTTDENIDQLRWSDFESNIIDSVDGRIHVQPADGAQQGLRLVFTSVEKEDAGVYTCSDVQDSTSFELIVSRSISFSDTPRVQHAPEGENGVVLCNIRSDAHPVVTWYFKSRQVKSNHPKYQILENHSLKIFNLSRNDAGDYKCKALLITSLSTQMKDLDIKLHVQYSPEIVGEQRINYYARLDTVIQLPCTVTADPDPMFQWLRDEMIIYNNTKGYTVFNTPNSSALQFAFETEEQLGEYICRANNALGQEEVIVVLKEGGPPHPPTISVKSEDNGVLTLNIEPNDDSENEEELKTRVFRVQYMLVTESWDNANTVQFKIGQPYMLKNVSFNSEYVIRAAGHNIAGYGKYSEELTYKTHSLQTASVVASASGIVASSLVLFTSIVFFRLF